MVLLVIHVIIFLLHMVCVILWIRSVNVFVFLNKKYSSLQHVLYYLIWLIARAITQTTHTHTYIYMYIYIYIYIIHVHVNVSNTAIWPSSIFRGRVLTELSYLTLYDTMFSMIIDWLLWFNVFYTWESPLHYKTCSSHFPDIVYSQWIHSVILTFL